GEHTPPRPGYEGYCHRLMSSFYRRQGRDQLSTPSQRRNQRPHRFGLRVPRDRRGIAKLAPSRAAAARAVANESGLRSRITTTVGSARRIAPRHGLEQLLELPREQVGVASERIRSTPWQIAPTGRCIRQKAATFSWRSRLPRYWRIPGA